MKELKILQQDLLNINKYAIQKSAIDIIKSLDEGELNPLEILKVFKSVEKLFEEIKPSLDKYTLMEANKYPEKTLELYNTFFTKKESPAQYDYRGCNDDVYIELKERQKLINEAIKERETFLKAIPNSIELTNEETGEIKRVFAPTTTSKTIIQVSIK